MTDYQEFDAYVDAHAGDYLEELVELSRIPSISAQAAPGVGEAASYVMGLCAEAGLETDMILLPGAPPVILGQAGSGARGLLVYNHYDVQPPDPLDEWTSPPFAPEIREGRLYGRGVSDNKGDLVARLAAVRAYQETLGPLPLRLCFVIEGEEEVGSPHLAALARDQAELLGSLHGCLWEGGGKDESGRPIISLGVKGIYLMEIRVRTANGDAHSANGGLFPNAVWRLTEALSTLRTPDGRVTVDGFMDHVRPPSARDLALLEQVPFDEEAIQQARGLKGFLGGLTGTEAVRRLMYEPTCSINGFVGGYTGPGTKTVIPCQAMAKLDFRLVPDLSPALASRLVRQHLERRGCDDIEVLDCGDGLMPVRTDPDSPLVAATVAALAGVHDVQPVVYPTSAGSGPMYQLCQGNELPTVATGVGWAGSRAHAPNESIQVADLTAGIKVIGRILHEFAAEPLAS